MYETLGLKLKGSVTVILNYYVHIRGDSSDATVMLLFTFLESEHGSTLISSLLN